MTTHIAPALDPVEAVRDQFGDDLAYVKTFAGETTLVVTVDALPEVMKFLKSTPGLFYNFLSDISAVDYYPNDYGNVFDGKDKDYRPERFGVSYHIYSMLYNRRLRVKTFVMEEDPVVPTVTHLWIGGEWLEREIFDMMGITFDGNKDMRRLLMPDDWDGHPHRRDYPLGYETVMFSFNAEEIRKHKPFAKD